MDRRPRGRHRWVDLALAGRPDEDRRLARAMLDHRTWTAMSEQGITDVRGVLLRLLPA
jgi:hypothetical protein